MSQVRNPSFVRLLCLIAVLMIVTRGFPTLSQTGTTTTASYSAEVALDWSALHLRLVRRTWGFSPPVASRAFGYLGVTLYESVVAGMPEHRSLAHQLNELDDLPQAIPGETYHRAAVANSALATMTKLMFPTAHAAYQEEIDALYEQYADTFLAETDDDTFTRSVEYGRMVAEAVYAWSLADGGHEGYRRNFQVDYEYPGGEGLWEPTTRAKGNPQVPMQPHWGENRPFILTSGEECAPLPRPEYSAEADSEFYAEAFEVYTITSQLSAEQREIARFWADDPFRTATPAGHSISILTQVLEHEEASLAVAAEAYARMGIGLADAFISCWNAKFRYNLLRPVTYIQRVIDPDWHPLLTTPPFPEYPSGHSVESGAAAAILSGMFGSAYPFTDATHEAWGLPSRSFASFAAFAREAAESRIYGGIHFRSAIENGLEQGSCVAARVNAIDFSADN